MKGYQNVLVILFFLLSVCSHAQSFKDVTPDRFEILVSDASTQAFESLFGHASILVIPEGKTWEEGFVFSFVALTGKNSNLVYYKKGLTGGFPFIVESVSALAFFNSKIVHEKRDIQRMILPLTKEQKNNLWKTLLDFKEHPEKLGNYYFHVKNCASMIYFLLKKSGVQVNYNQLILRSIASGMIPKQLMEKSRSVLLSPLPSDVVPSTASVLIGLNKKYGIQINSRYDDATKVFKNWTSKEKLILSQLSLEELVFASQSISYLDNERSGYIQDLIRNKKQRIKVRFVRYKEYPKSFYSICEEKDDACLKGLVNDVKITYSLAFIKKLARKNSFAEIEAFHTFQPEFNFFESEQARHWRNLTKGMRELK